MRTVVTGASGHIGGVLVRALLARNHAVLAADLVRGPTLDGLDVEFSAIDVTHPASLNGLFAGAEVVVHLAAVISVVGDPKGIVRAVNVDGAENVARAALAAGVGRYVHVSSVHAFDLEQVTATLTEESPRAIAAHLPPYDLSKYAGELRVRTVIADGLPAVIVNPTGVIGPDDFGPSRMGQIFRSMRERQLPFVIQGGFDWVDVRDVADGIVGAAERGRVGENYLLAGTHTSVADLMALAAVACGSHPPRFTIPMTLARAWGPVGTLVARRTGSALAMTTESLHALRFDPEVSSAKAKHELGYRSRPIDTTVRDIYEWISRRE